MIFDIFFLLIKYFFTEKITTNILTSWAICHWTGHFSSGKTAYRTCSTSIIGTKTGTKTGTIVALVQSSLVIGLWMAKYVNSTTCRVAFVVVGLKIGSLSSCMFRDYWLRYGSCASFTVLDQKKWNPCLNILHLNGTRFTIIPRKFLQSAKEFGCYTIMCVVIYI